MAVNSILSAAAKAACAMFREAVEVTGKLFAQMKGAALGLKNAGIQFAGDIGRATNATAAAVAGSGPPVKGTSRA